jgi:hypothetical protein
MLMAFPKQIIWYQTNGRHSTAELQAWKIMTCRKVEDKYGIWIQLSIGQKDFLALRPEQKDKRQKDFMTPGFSILSFAYIRNPNRAKSLPTDLNPITNCK